MATTTHKPFSPPDLESLAIEPDKPDSPVSPLRARPTPATTSSSSSSGSAAAAAATPGLSGRRTRSGELLLGPAEPLHASSSSRPGHRRSGSGALFYSSGGGGGGSSASSPAGNLLPAGNICPSGRVGKSGIINRSAPTRSDVLGSGSGNYGHGSIMRGGRSAGDSAATAASANGGGDLWVRRAMSSPDPEEVKRIGNEQYKRGNFAEALRIYDRAIAMCPENAACRSNRAAALTGLRRLGEAVRECEEAVRIDPGFGRAHQRLASLHVRLGQVEDARKHLFLAGQQPDPAELQKVQAVERHLGRCADARKTGDWKSALRESDAAIAAGADSSPLLIASRAEALLHLHQLDEADSALSSTVKLESSASYSPQTRFFGMLSSSYMHIVRAQVEMARGRFENAVAAAEKARQVDPRNIEVTMTLNKIRSAARARAQGNEFFNLGKFDEACIAYGEGLKYYPSNAVLYCNRAACRSKLGQWEKSVEDCNEALRIQPNYTKALLRRAASNGKLERWAESVRDYEVLKKDLPDDTEVAEALFHAQVALKTSRGEVVSNMKFGGEVEVITGLEQFHAAITLPGVSVVHFMAALNQHCIQITPFVDALCNRYPSVNFLKVDVNESPAVSRVENVRIVPTFKIYKNGTRVKEMVCPSQQILENSVRHYGL